MEDNANKFLEKMRGLLAFAKKKKNVLEYQEINEFLGDAQFTPEQIEKIYEFLEKNGVDVLRMTNLEEVELSNNITWLGEETFKGCEKLKKVNIFFLL